MENDPRRRNPRCYRGLRVLPSSAAQAIRCRIGSAGTLTVDPFIVSSVHLLVRLVLPADLVKFVLPFRFLPLVVTLAFPVGLPAQWVVWLLRFNISPLDGCGCRFNISRLHGPRLPRVRRTLAVVRNSRRKPWCRCV